MRTRQDVIDFCLSLDDTYEDYPFHDFNWTVMRHKSNKKMFAAICERMGNIWVNVKCDPNLTHMWWSALLKTIINRFLNAKTLIGFKSH